MKYQVQQFILALRGLKDRFIAKMFALFCMLFASSAAFAADTGFDGFQDAVTGFAQGPFAIGISIVALVLGAIGGLAKMSAWPALVGFAVAAVFALGPYIILEIFRIFTAVS